MLELCSDFVVKAWCLGVDEDRIPPEVVIVFPSACIDCLLLGRSCEHFGHCARESTY